MSKRLYLSQVDKQIFGVCGGVANYFGIDSSVVRLLWALAALPYGGGLLAYIVAAFIIPREPLPPMEP